MCNANKDCLYETYYEMVQALEQYQKVHLDEDHDIQNVSTSISSTLSREAIVGENITFK